MYAVIVEWNDGEWSMIQAHCLVCSVRVGTESLRWGDGVRFDVIRRDGHEVAVNVRRAGRQL